MVAGHFEIKDGCQISITLEITRGVANALIRVMKALGIILSL